MGGERKTIFIITYTPRLYRTYLELGRLLGHIFRTYIIQYYSLCNIISFRKNITRYNISITSECYYEHFRKGNVPKRSGRCTQVTEPKCTKLNFYYIESISLLTFHMLLIVQLKTLNTINSFIIYIYYVYVRVDCSITDW